MGLTIIRGLKFAPSPTTLPSPVVADFRLKSTSSSPVILMTRYSVAVAAPVGFGPGGSQSTQVFEGDVVQPVATTVKHQLYLDWRKPNRATSIVPIDAKLSDSDGGQANLVATLTVRGMTVSLKRVSMSLRGTKPKAAKRTAKAANSRAKTTVRGKQG